MPLNETSLILVKEHRFKCVVGRKMHLFVVEELVEGPADWLDKFRLRFCASARSKIATIFGAGCYEVAEKAAQYVVGIARRPSHAGISRTNRPSQGPPLPSRQTLQTLQVQESESD
jgi:hypothetical protein